MALPANRRTRRRIRLLVGATAIGALLIIGLLVYQIAVGRWSWKDAPKRDRSAAPAASVSEIAGSPAA